MAQIPIIIVLQLLFSIKFKQNALTKEIFLFPRNVLQQSNRVVSLFSFCKKIKDLLNSLSLIS